MKRLLLILFPVVCIGQVTVTGSRVDLSHSLATKPLKDVTVLPTGVAPQLPCVPGDMVRLTTATPTAQIYINTGTGNCVWNQQSGAGGGGLADPGANGLISRTALNVTAPATSTDVISVFSGCSGTLLLGADGNCHPGGSGGGLADPGANGVIKRISQNITAPALSSDVIGLFTGCAGTNYLGADGACHIPSTGGLQDPGANGVVFRSALNTTNPATAANIVSLFSICSGTQYLGADGACHTPPSSGPGGSYVTPATTPPQAISAATHQQGINADVVCFDSPVSGGATTGHEVLCDWQKDAAGNITVNWAGTAVVSIQVFAAGPVSGGGGSANPGGSPGQIQFNSAGSFGGFTANGDATVNTTTGAVTVTKTNGNVFASSATTDTTNAGNITSGILAVPRGGTGVGTITGIIKGNGVTPFSAALFSDVVSLFSGCVGANYLGADGNCHVASAAGTVYVTNATTSPQTITAVTHGQGASPWVFCWDGALSAGAPTGNFVQCAIQKNSAGDVVIQWTGSGVGSIEVMSGGTSGGGGGVTQVNTSLPLSGGPITTNGTISCPTCTTNPSTLTNGRLVFGGGGQVAAVGDLSGDATTSGSGVVTFASVNSGSGVCGDSTHVCQITTNAKGLTTSQALIPITAGTVGTTGTMGVNAITTWAGGSNIQTPNAATTIDTSGNIKTPGWSQETLGHYCVASAYSPDITTNSVGLLCPSSVPLSYQWTLPSADAAGVLVSDGAGTPGHLSIVATTGSGNILRASGAAPPTSGTVPLKGNGTGGFANAVGSDIVALFSACSGTQYLGADAACHTAAGTPGGSSGQVQFNNSGSFSGFTVNGDGTLNTSTGALTVTRTNGTAFAASATTDTTNAGNITTGILAVARGGTGVGTITGVIKGNGTSPFTAAAATDLVALFSGCSGTQYLGADGACHNPGSITAPVTIGSSIFSGSPALTVQSAGSLNNGGDSSPVEGLLGSGATSQAAILHVFHPVSEGLSREAAVVGGTVTTNLDTNWETDGGVFMVVAKNSPSLGGGSVGIAGYAASAVSGGTVWATNMLVQDADRTNTTCTGQFQNTCHFPSTLIGMEMDANVWDTGSNLSEINLGVQYLNGHTVSATRAISINLAGCSGSFPGCGSNNFFDYGIVSDDGAASVFAHVGLNHNPTNSSQFIDLVSGSTGQFTTRLWADSTGELVILPNQSGGGTSFVKVDVNGNIIATAGGLTTNAGVTMHSLPSSSGGNHLCISSGGVLYIGTTSGC